MGRSWSFCPIENVTTLIFSAFNPFTQTLTTIQPLIYLSNFLGILWLIHPSLIRKLKHSQFLRIFWLTVQLYFRIKLPHIMRNSMFFPLLHNASNKRMWINLILGSGGFFSLKSGLMMSCNLRCGCKRFGVWLMKGFLEWGDVLGFTLKKGGTAGIGRIHFWVGSKFIYLVLYAWSVILHCFVNL